VPERNISASCERHQAYKCNPAVRVELQILVKRAPLLAINKDEIESVLEGLQGSPHGSMGVHLLLEVLSPHRYLTFFGSLSNLLWGKDVQQPSLRLALTERVHLFEDHPGDEVTQM
jgi:hypothetical protein